jgi:hypothetical protein
MRALLVAALVFVAALAGCSGKKGDADEDLHYKCSDGTEVHSDDYAEALENLTEDSQIKDFLKTKCPKSGSGTGSKSNSTSLAPNVLPILKLNVTDAGGNATLVTLKGGNLTFSAAGSSDPDGTISAIAITVKDSNQTRTRSLYDATTKKFTSAKFVFDRAGPVNVSVAMVDDRAGFTTNVSHVYINEKFHIEAPLDPDPQVANDACEGARPTFGTAGQEGSGPVVDSRYFKSATFTVSGVAQYIEATPTKAKVTICDPEYAPISDAKQTTTVLSNNAEPLPPPLGAKAYSVGMYLASPGAPGTATSVDVTVHYDPRPAAAA